VGHHSADGDGDRRRAGDRDFRGGDPQRAPTWFSRIWGGYVEIIRNTPFVVQLFFIVFGLPNLGLKMTAGKRRCWRWW
jgi:ABC-type amino acid transport system permease subunit